ncbi:hypothetical protein [Streptomyces incanus]|uniref:Uncharacterized protein n=1 Tax=Streptomyces incanus TaxID=887453 RepID=A0ABW0XVF9_9ACTN
MSQRQFDVESAWHGTPFIVNKTIRSTCRGNRRQRPWEPDTEATIQAAAAADVGNADQPEPEPQAAADEPAPAPQASADELAAKRIRRPKVDSAAADKPKPRPARKCTAAKPAAAKATDIEPTPRPARKRTPAKPATS